MDFPNDEQQLATKLREFAGNTSPRGVNIKKEKESIQNSAIGASQRNRNGLKCFQKLFISMKVL